MTIEALLERIAVALERQAEAPPAAEPPKRGRPVGSTKAVEPPPPSVPTAVVPAPAPAPAELPEPDSSFLDDEPAPAAVVLTADDVRKALIDFGKKPGCSQEKARALLKQYGHVDTLKALKPEHFKAVIDAAGA